MTAPDPCPRCGSACEAVSGPVPDRWGVRCIECGLWADDREGTEADAIAAWNRRAALPARGVGVKPLVDAVEALNAACDAMWNDHHRLELNPSLFGQEMRIKEKHVKAITEAQQRLPAILAALAPTDAAQAREAALMEAHKAILAMDTKKDEDLTYNLAVLRAAEKVRRLINEART